METNLFWNQYSIKFQSTVQILWNFFCMFRNCRSHPVVVDCEFVKKLRMYLFFLPVKVRFEVSVVFSSWKLHSPFTVQEADFLLFFFLMTCYTWHMYNMNASDLILLKIFSFIISLLKGCLCNSEVPSDIGEQERQVTCTELQSWLRSHILESCAVYILIKCWNGNNVYARHSFLDKDLFYCWRNILDSISYQWKETHVLTPHFSKIHGVSWNLFLCVSVSGKNETLSCILVGQCVRGAKSIESSNCFDMF